MKTIVSAIVSALILGLTSCVVPQGGYYGRPTATQSQRGGQRYLSSVDVSKAVFEARIDSHYANRRQDVCDFAAARFEQTGRTPSDQEVSRHFGFECHVRLKGQIQTVKVRPDEVPANIRARFQ